MTNQPIINKLLQYSFLGAGLLIGGLLGMTYQMKVMQQEALDKDLAHYDTKTGVWKWGSVIQGITMEELNMPALKPVTKGTKK